MMKNYNLKSIPLLLAILFLFSCSHRKEAIFKAAKEHTIEATLAGIGNDTIFVSYLAVSEIGNAAPAPQDTIYAKDGFFTYSLLIDEPVLLYFFPKKGEFTRMATSTPLRPDTKYLVLLVNPLETLTVQGELHEFYLDYQVQGSELNKQFAEVRQEFIGLQTEATRLELGLDTLMASNGNKDLVDQLSKTRNNINDIAKKAHLDFILNNAPKELTAFYLMPQPSEPKRGYL